MPLRFRSSAHLTHLRTQKTLEQLGAAAPEGPGELQCGTSQSTVASILDCGVESVDPESECWGERCWETRDAGPRQKEQSYGPNETVFEFLSHG